MSDYFEYLERSHRLRKAVVAVLVGWVLVNPIGSQILGLETPWLHSWTMFHRVGVGMYDVRFFESADAGLRPIRWPIPDRPPHTIRNVIAPPERLLRSPREARWVVDRLCAEADDPSMLRARIRRAALNGWELKVDVGSPLCSGRFDVE